MSFATYFEHYNKAYMDEQKTQQNPIADAQTTTPQQQNQIDEIKVESALTRALKKVFGAAQKETNAAEQAGTPKTDKANNEANEDKIDKMQKTLEDLQKQNAILVNRQEMDNLAKELRKQGFDVAENDLKTSQNANELKRKVLAKETQQDYSSETDDFVNGVFAAITIAKQKQQNNAEQQKSQIAKAVANGSSIIDPKYFPQEFVRTQVQRDKRDELKKKYDGVL